LKRYRWLVSGGARRFVVEEWCTLVARFAAGARVGAGGGTVNCGASERNSSTLLLEALHLRKQEARSFLPSAKTPVNVRVPKLERWRSGCASHHGCGSGQTNPLPVRLPADVILRHLSLFTGAMHYHPMTAWDTASFTGRPRCFSTTVYRNLLSWRSSIYPKNSSVA
jgi:hypothetical protein